MNYRLPKSSLRSGSTSRLSGRRPWRRRARSVGNTRAIEQSAAMIHDLGSMITTQRFPIQRPMSHWLTILNREVVACTRCPRLVTYREQVARVKRRAYRDCEYWGKPVHGFGDPDAQVLIMGLAPGAHGSNRTGRPFTGDASGKFMYPVLYESGFANQATATDRNDGLELKNLYITAAVRCAPPDNKPLPPELAECSQFLDREIAGLEKVKVVVALGKIGFDAYLNYLKRSGALASKQGHLFKHGASSPLPTGKRLLASYHPSNQNTQTGKLTREMFLEIFKQAAKFADE